MRRTSAAAAVVALAVALVIGGCGYNHGPLARQKAQELVSAAKAAGVGANVTVTTAEALYGTSAPAVCQLFHGSGTGLNLLANPGVRSYTVITSHARDYTRLVVKVYCPHRLSEYDRVAHGLRVDRSTR
jgi:hypothetical protein